MKKSIQNMFSRRKIELLEDFGNQVDQLTKNKDHKKLAEVVKKEAKVEERSKQEFYPEVPKKIVQVLARTLTSTTVDLENDEKRLLFNFEFGLAIIHIR